MNTIKAKYCDRFTVVKYENEIFVIETRGRKPLLMRNNNSGRRIEGDTEVEVIFWPAQLAFKYLEDHAPQSKEPNSQI